MKPQPHTDMHPRYDRLDALRGVAMVWMTVYHFCFDLNHFKWISADFYRDPLWTWQRTCIVSLFLLCAGMGQAIAQHQGQRWPRFWQRWGQVVSCALLVTLASYVMYPRSFIFFGVLHGIAVMLLIVRCATLPQASLWILGTSLIATKFIAAYAHETWANIAFFNEKAWSWLGLVSVKPVTEDFVPLVPWLGVMLWGVAAGQWLLRHRSTLLTGVLPDGTRWLAWLGGWSLTYYMLHQPVMLAALTLLQHLRGTQQF